MKAIINSATIFILGMAYFFSSPLCLSQTLSDEDVLIIDINGNAKLADGTVIDDPKNDPRVQNIKRIVYPASEMDKVPQWQCEVEPLICIGEFSVSESKKVCFSPGLLQYNAALGTHKTADGKTLPGTWRFAEHQYDYVDRGIVYYNGTKCNNSFASKTYEGWVDFFCWATSGYDNSVNDSCAIQCKPWSHGNYAACDNSGYGPSIIDRRFTLTGQYANYDWGVYNEILNGTTVDPPNMWRTLTPNEFYYLIDGRGDKSWRYARIQIDDSTTISGNIILPDDWDDFTSFPDRNKTYVFTLKEWNILEREGVVFLPLTGYLNQYGTIYDNTLSHLWTSGGSYLNDASFYYLGKRGAYYATGLRYYKMPIRLVRDL